MTLEKFIGSMLGCAAGDALGMCVESWKPEQIRKYVGRVTEPLDPVLVYGLDGTLLKEDEFGRLKYWNYTEGAKKGDITDDTILTLAVAKGIIRARGLNLDEMAKTHLEAYDNRQKDGVFKGGFGRTTKEAFDKLRKGISPYISGIPGAGGNGPVMKTSPLGLYMTKKKDPDDILEFAATLAKMTHLDYKAITPAVVQTYAIDMVFRGHSGRILLSDIYALSKDTDMKESNQLEIPKDSLTNKIAWILSNMNAPDELAYNTLGNSGLATESYSFALFMFQKYMSTPVQGLIETINWGGDSDSTGAIFGALAGAKYGAFHPREWLIKDENMIVDTAIDLHRNTGSRYDHESITSV